MQEGSSGITFRPKILDFATERRVIIQFNIKMLNPCKDETIAECVLSPKETEERKARQLVLQKIDREIDGILSLNSQHHQQYEQFIEKIAFIEEHYKAQNKQLQSALEAMTAKYSSLEAIYLSLKEELEQTYSSLQKTESVNKQLLKENGKLKEMIKNQESLIDDYRKNIEEEINLERECIKLDFEEKKAEMMKEFNCALLQIEKQYESKIKKTKKQIKLEDYHHECRELKRYLTSGSGIRDLSVKEDRALKVPQSEYSTAEQQPRHNQPIFML